MVIINKFIYIKDATISEQPMVIINIYIYIYIKDATISEQPMVIINIYV